MLLTIRPPLSGTRRPHTAGTHPEGRRSAAPPTRWLRWITNKTLLLWGALAAGAIAALGTAVGVVVGSICDHQYCDATLGSTCVFVGPSSLFTCCKDLDGDGIKHCVTCLRDGYMCDTGFQYGPAYNCTNPGDLCS